LQVWQPNRTWWVAQRLDAFRVAVLVITGYGVAPSGKPVEYRQGVLFSFIEWFGDLGIFWRLAWAAVSPPYEFRALIRQLESERSWAR